MLSIFRSCRLASIGLLAAVTFAPHPAYAQADKLNADQAIEDLDRLYEGLTAVSADLFSETPKSIFDARYAELVQRLDGPVSKADLHTGLQRFAALARHAHARIDQLNPGWYEHVDANGLVFPLSFDVIDGEVIVSGAPVDSGIEPGDRIVALEGDPNPIWLSRLRRNISAETPELAYAMMAGGEPYFVWLEYGARSEFNVKIERDGEFDAVTLEAQPLSALSELRTGDKGFDLAGREARFLDENIAYLRPGAFYNLDAKTPEEAYDPAGLARYKLFIDNAFETFIDSDAEHLILDLRDNGGGDISFSDPVVAWFATQPFRFTSDFRVRVSEETTASNQTRLDARPGDTESISAKLAELYTRAEIGDLVSYEMPFVEPRAGERFYGSVHVMVNRFSYSNAVTTAALIQDYGFGTIYGEPTRDMATTFGAMEQFSLPNSGFIVGYPKAHIIRPNGEEKSHPVTPDVSINIPSVRGEDDVMLDELVRRLQEN